MTSPVLIHGTFLWSRSASFTYTMASSKHHHDSGLGLGGGCTNWGPKLSRAGCSPSASQTSTADARIFKFIEFSALCFAGSVPQPLWQPLAGHDMITLNPA